MTKRQMEHAAKMRAKRGKRPYDEKNEDDARRYILSLRKLFQMGMSDEFIAHALNIDRHLVSILRDAHLPSRPKSRVRS
jgi:hypothetical protein